LYFEIYLVLWCLDFGISLDPVVCIYDLVICDLYLYFKHLSMAYAVCKVPVAPLRAEPAHKSEMVSQVLLAEAALILEEAKDFIKLQSIHDGYEGWCQRSQLAVVDTFTKEAASKTYTDSWVNTITINNVPAHVPMGIPVLSEINAKELSAVLKIDYRNAAVSNTAKPNEDAIKERAMPFLSTPYLWGGRSVFGIDCSGFTQMVFRFFNIPLLRDAYLQATQGEVVGFLQEASCGDLAFFDNAEGRITHVGVLLNDHEIIHSSGNVRIDKIDNAGIVNAETGVRTHQLRIIKRYF
jgi:cell wall-associated NlpC family hydrolase